MGKGGKSTTRKAASSTTSKLDALSKKVTGEEEKERLLKEFVEKALAGERRPFNVPKDYPEMSEVMAVIPERCFEKSTVKSLAYAAFSTGLTLLTGFLAYHYLPSPSTYFTSPVSFLLWSAYGFINGAIATGCWVVAHECGHGAFSDNKVIQDTVGYILHSALLVPYFSWQRSHAVHHSRTNHVSEGETHVPDQMNTPKGESAFWMHKVLGDDSFAVINLFQHLVLGWPAYLLAGITGSPKRGFSNHFIPTNTELFPNAWQRKVWLSDIGVIGMIAALYYIAQQTSSSLVLALYVGPYMWVNMWLVLYTWLQHTDVDIAHFDGDDWTWVKGAFSTVDRPYPQPFDFLHHKIGSTHVAHHLCSRIPHYHADEATRAIKKAFPQYYLYDPSSITTALWRVGRKCVACVEHGHNRWVFADSTIAKKFT